MKHLMVIVLFAYASVGFAGQTVTKTISCDKIYSSKSTNLGENATVKVIKADKKKRMIAPTLRTKNTIR